MTTLRLATRGSPLALEQARRVAERFARLDRPVDTVVVITETRGDRDPESPIRLLGRDGAFAAEVELAVLEGRADVAVHSAKDLPSVALLEGLVLAATPERVDVRDAFVGNTLEGLPSRRTRCDGLDACRRAQIAWLRPDLGFVELRGNIATRLAKVPTNGLVVVAFAALVRLGLAETVDEVLSTDLVLPQVGQGALALRCRSDDEVTLQLCVAIDDAPVHRAIEAERARSCATRRGVRRARLRVCELLARLAVGPSRGVRRPRGRSCARAWRADGDDPAALGRALADDVLDRRGGRASPGTCRLMSMRGAGDRSGSSALLDWAVVVTRPARSRARPASPHSSCTARPSLLCRRSRSPLPKTAGRFFATPRRTCPSSTGSCSPRRTRSIG